MGRRLVLGVSAVLVACTHDFDAFKGGAPEPTDAGAPETSAPPVDAAPPPPTTRDAAADAGLPCTEPDAERALGHCYFRLPQSNLTFDAAESACRAASAHLATITSDAENDVVRGLLRTRDRWIGLRRPAGSPSNDASFAWVTGEGRGFASWGPDEPNGSGECVRMRMAGTWGDQSCDGTNGAICERE